MREATPVNGCGACLAGGHLDYTSSCADCRRWPVAPKPEPLYRIVWAGGLEADADIALSWPRLLYALRQYVPYTTKRLSAHVARVERVWP